MNKQPAGSRRSSGRRARAAIPHVLEIAEQIEKIAQARAAWMFEAACAEVTARRFRETGFLGHWPAEKPPEK